MRALCAIKTPLLRLITLILLLYVAAVIGMYLFQRQLLYLAQPSNVQPAQAGVAQVQNLSFENEGEHLQYWFIAPRAGQPSIVYFHGNAGDLSDRAAYMRTFSEAGYGVAVMSYRGFGQSTGRPTEQAIYRDADAFIRLLTQRHSIAPAQMILFGESLGTGVATEMALSHDAAALVLQSPYISVLARAQELYPWLPVALLLHDRFDSLAKIGRVQAPLLIIHGLKDEVIPPAHGKALFAAAKQPKQLRLLPQYHHSDFPAALILNELRTFYEKYALAR